MEEFDVWEANLHTAINNFPKSSFKPSLNNSH